MTINPKKHLEHFEDFSVNKKHKGQKNSTPGMDFENLASSIATSRQIDNFDAPKNEYAEQRRFKSVVTKIKFSQTNDKRFCNLNGATSLPMGHPYLKDLAAYKESKGEMIDKYFIKEKENFKKLEIETFAKNDRLNLYNQMLG